MNRFKKVSFRLKGWDYRKKASYFITICTKNRQHYFGKIENKKMILSNIGVIADILWHEIKNHTNNIKLDEFVVMPNHIHGILIIDSDSVTPLQFDSVAPLHARGLQNQKNQYFSDISPKAGSISTIIRSYKSAVTKHSRRLAYEFGWQAKFHDHIIRNEEEYFKIRNNPQKWDEDKFY